MQAGGYSLTVEGLSHNLLLMKLKCLIALLLVSLLLANDAGAGDQSPGEEARFLLSALRMSGPISLCGEEVPLHIQDVRERFEKELLLTAWNVPQVILWLKRSKRYLGIVDELIRAGNLPQDLRFVPVAESALLPHSVSSKKAVGFWQFIPSSGKRYGLRIDSDIDERREIRQSTEAALKYLLELKERFGSWTLALAAYNMGEDGLAAEINAQGVEDFYLLYLPLETQRYIFRILSAKLVMTNPSRWGFNLEEGDYYQPLSYETVTVNCPEHIPLKLIAKAAGTHFKMIKDLNPKIRGHFLSKGTHEIKIPKGSAKAFQSEFQRLIRGFVLAKSEMVYTVKSGDSLSSISSRFDVPLPSLLIWNKLDPKKPIHPGDKIIVYKPQTMQQFPDSSIDEEN
jgi:hypothetical protein